MPDGVLVFFPSYYLLNSCIEAWQTVVSVLLDMYLVYHVSFPSHSHLVLFVCFCRCFKPALKSFLLQTSGPAATVWERICRNKQPVVEPKESALFNQANEVK